MAYETEELWFTEWEFGGPYFEPAARENYERNNPVNFVQNFRTPMLVLHGERDFRIPVQPVARPVQRAATAERPVAAGRVPGRESLDPAAAELDPMVSRGAWLARSLPATGGRPAP